MSLSVQQQLISFMSEDPFILWKSAELVPGNSSYWILIGPRPGKSLCCSVIGWNWPVYKQKTSYDEHLWVSFSGQRIQMFSLISRENWFCKQDTHPVTHHFHLNNYIHLDCGGIFVYHRQKHFNSAITTTLSYHHKIVYFRILSGGRHFMILEDDSIQCRNVFTLFIVRHIIPTKDKNVLCNVPTLQHVTNHISTMFYADNNSKYPG